MIAFCKCLLVGALLAVGAMAIHSPSPFCAAESAPTVALEQTAVPAPPAATPATRPTITRLPIQGLARPESFLIDPETGLSYISNINGGGTAIDNNGFITRLRPDLTVGERMAR